MTQRVCDPLTMRLRLRDEVTCTPRAVGGEASYLVEDRLRGKFYQVGAAEFAVIGLCDGSRSLQECVGLAARRVGAQALDEREAVAVARWLLDTQLATTLDSAAAETLTATAERATQRRWFERCNPLVVQLPLLNPDRLLTRLVSCGAGAIISWPACAVLLLLCGWALQTAWVESARLAAESRALLAPHGWWTLAGVWLLLTVGHELLHGLACKKFGGNVTRGGVMLLLFAPVAFLDVTNAWRLPSKWARIVVSAAGMGGDLCIAAVATLNWAFTTSGWEHDLALRIAALASVGTLVFNANPLVRFDGYHILTDLVEIPNLAAQGRQALLHFVARWGLGLELSSALPTGWRGRFVQCYAWAALAWRAMMLVGLMLLAVALFGALGGWTLAACLLLWQGVPMALAARNQWRSVRHAPCNQKRRRLSMAIGLATCGAAVAACWLPGRITAPAVVEYAPLVVVRAGTPGFVRAVFVANGQQVAADQPLLALVNDELTAELREMQLKIEQSRVKERMLRQGGELAKLQAEAAARQALERQTAELAERVAALVVRSPQGGQVVGRQLAQLTGRYLQAGDEIAVVGDERTKELVLAVPQEDVELFAAQLSSPCRVYLAGSAAARYTGTLARVEPRAATQLPHAALAAAVGGPLAVRLLSRDARADRETYELINPCFSGAVALPATFAAELRAGQRATISFRTARESLAVRSWHLALRWVDRQLAAYAVKER